MQRQENCPTVYIAASGFRGTPYIGVTSQTMQRDHQHKHSIADGFIKKYGCKLLVWYEFHETVESPVLREKPLKSGSRNAKIKLIEAENDIWRDLSNLLQL